MLLLVVVGSSGVEAIDDVTIPESAKYKVAVVDRKQVDVVAIPRSSLARWLTSVLRSRSASFKIGDCLSDRLKSEFAVLALGLIARSMLGSCTVVSTRRILPALS